MLSDELSAINRYKNIRSAPIFMLLKGLHFSILLLTVFPKEHGVSLIFIQCHTMMHSDAIQLLSF